MPQIDWFEAKRFRRFLAVDLPAAPPSDPDGAGATRPTCSSSPYTLHARMFSSWGRSSEPKFETLPQTDEVPRQPTLCVISRAPGGRKLAMDPSGQARERVQ